MFLWFRGETCLCWVIRVAEPSVPDENRLSDAQILIFTASHLPQLHFHLLLKGSQMPYMNRLLSHTVSVTADTETSEFSVYRGGCGPRPPSIGEKLQSKDAIERKQEYISSIKNPRRTEGTVRGDCTPFLWPSSFLWRCADQISELLKPHRVCLVTPIVWNQGQSCGRSGGRFMVSHRWWRRFTCFHV